MNRLKIIFEICSKLFACTVYFCSKLFVPLVYFHMKKYLGNEIYPFSFQLPQIGNDMACWLWEKIWECLRKKQQLIQEPIFTAENYPQLGSEKEVGTTHQQQSLHLEKYYRTLQWILSQGEY